MKLQRKSSDDAILSGTQRSCILLWPADQMQPPTIFSPFFPYSLGILAGVSISDATKKNIAQFSEKPTWRPAPLDVLALNLNFSCLFPPHNCLNCDHCLMNEKLSYSVCFWTVLRCTSFCSCFFFSLHGFVFLWHAKTSILESVKLLKQQSVHGSGLDFLPSVFVLLLFFAGMFQTIFTRSCILFSVCYCYC